jgi:DhnA family fructose-bisphosphate aldolase class Ia
VPHITVKQLEELRDLRARDPRAISSRLRERRRREILREDGRLFIVAADHPARGSLGVRDLPLAMADRYGLLERLAIALSRPGVDGVLATPDIVDDLAALGLLDGKVVVGSMNRGGVRGAAFEMDDRYTGYDVAAMEAGGLDMAKALVRINLEDAATAATLEKTAQAVTAAARAGLPIILEPFMSRWVDDRIVNDLSTDAVVTSVAIASGLGADSTLTWLKLPVVDDMARVMAATTLPTLLLGGDEGGPLEAVLESWARALALPGVRGLTAGRALLYPPGDDVAGAVDAAAALVHQRTFA